MKLYDINKRLMTLEGRLLRLAENRKVNRKTFLENYIGNELDPAWLGRMEERTDKGWKDFVVKDRAEVDEIRAEIAQMAGAAGLDIGEFKRMIMAVQKGERETNRAKKEMIDRSGHGLRYHRHRTGFRHREIQEARWRRLFQNHQPASAGSPENTGLHAKANW